MVWDTILMELDFLAGEKSSRLLLDYQSSPEYHPIVDAERQVLGNIKEVREYWERSGVITPQSRAYEGTPSDAV